MNMENLFNEIDKAYGFGYAIIWKDYMNRKKEITKYSGEEFVEKFIELVMVLHQLYVIIDILYTKEFISERTYESVIKCLENEKMWLKELLIGMMSNEV